MALSTPVSRGFLGSATDGTAYSTSSGSPSADALLIAWVGAERSASDVETPSVSGSPWSLSWSRIAALDLGYTTGGATNRAGFVFVAKTTTAPGADTFDVTFANTHIGCEMFVVEYTGADLSGAATAAIVQTDTQSGITQPFTGMTLSAASDSANRGLTFWAINNNSVTITPEGGWTQLTDTSHTAPTIRAAVHYIPGFDTTPTSSPSDAANKVWGGWGMEVKAAPDARARSNVRRSMTPQTRAGVW